MSTVAVWLVADVTTSPQPHCGSAVVSSWSG